MGEGQWPIMIGYVAFFVIMMYLLIFLPQKKREKKAKEMLSNLKVDDVVLTIGGISGKIVNIKDDEITIETSLKRTQMVFKKWGIKEVVKTLEA